MIDYVKHNTVSSQTQAQMTFSSHFPKNAAAQVIIIKDTGTKRLDFGPESPDVARLGEREIEPIMLLAAA